MDSVAEVTPDDVEVGEAPTHDGQAVGVIERFGDTDAVTSVTDPLVEVSTLAKNPWEIKSNLTLPPPSPARRSCPSRGTSSWRSGGTPQPSRCRRCAGTPCQAQDGSGRRAGACRAGRPAPMLRGNAP